MSTDSPEASSLLGRTLGDFVVRNKLAEGGFGSVYLAEQPALAREAVIKVLHARHRADEGVIQRFLREARLASKLDHPYAAHTYAFGAEPDGLLWIAMERVRGTPLDQLLRAQTRLPLDRFSPLLDKMCEVLATAHEQGIVHRDVKPANVMVLSRAGRLLPKLLDFGIAKAVNEATPDVSAPNIRSVAPSALGADDDTLAGGELEETLRTEGGAVDHLGLTRRGEIIGSPPYMAPEQWINGAIGPSTDLYALGVLAFEALSGAPPFRGGTLLAIARAHAQAPVPSLGEGFPPALDTVLRKAMAKRSGERYDGALAFAAAFREAAGLGGDALALPRLDDRAREAALLDSPQPIAEAVAELDAASTLHRAVDAVAHLITIAARLVGLIALAARTQIGTGDGDAQVVSDTLRILRRRPLGDREWVELARALVRSFRACADAHPLPELVAMLVEDSDPFSPLLELADEAAAARGGETALRARLERALPFITQLLGALSFLSDYPLVVVLGGVATRWLGVRRGRRTPIKLSRPVAEGRPVITSRSGTPLLQLWPLFQVGEPTPGAPEELFMFEGMGRHGARLIAHPAGFERGDDGIWDWFRAIFPIAGGETAGPTEPEQAPYRGLSAFAVEDAATFVGRERESVALINRLRSQAFVAVVGPSGAGKSSFVHAGVLPNLPERWRAISLRPTATPLAALITRVAAAGVEAPRIDGLREDPGLLRAALAAFGGGDVVVLVVDQFEESFTLCTDASERQTFFAALAATARAAEDPLRVLLTVRDDFLMRAEGEAVLREHLARGLQLIGTPSRVDLTRILVEPARRAGYEFEDRALPAEMVAAAADQPGALPLLSFTAARMWELRDRHFKQLSRKVYNALGGVAGALAQHAEQTLAKLVPNEQRILRDGFRHLVTADGTRATLSREELLRVMNGGEVASLVLEKMIRARLLVISDAEGGGDRIEIIHETLLSSWPRLVRWRQEDAEGARLRDQLRAAARQWNERGRADGMLWRDEALTELQLWRSRNGAPLPEVDEAFADRSLATARRSRGRVRVAIGVAFLVLVGVAAGFFQLSRRARASEREARARVAELYEDQGRQALLEEDPQRALVYLREAMRGGRRDASLQFLLGRALQAIAPLQRTVVAHESGVNRAVYSADRRRVLSSGRDGTARIWDADSWRQLRSIDTGSALWKASFVDHDRAVVTVSVDGMLRRYDPESGTERATTRVAPASTAVRLGTLGRDAVRVFVAHTDKLSVLEAGSLRLLRTLAPGGPLAAALDVPDAVESNAEGTMIAAATTTGELRVWSVDSGVAILSTRLSAPAARLRFAAGQRLIVGDAVGAITVIDLRSGARTVLAGGHIAAVTAIAISADDRLLATGSQDGMLRVVELSSGALRWGRVGHHASVLALAFSPDGLRLLSSSSDGSARMWQSDDGLALSYLIGHRGSAYLGAFDGDVALTFGSDGTMRLWRTRPMMIRAQLPSRGEITSIVVSADGRTVYAGCLDSAVHGWDLASGEQRWQVDAGLGQDALLAISSVGPSVLGLRYTSGELEVRSLPSLDLISSARSPGPVFESCQLSADGRTAVTGHADGSTRLWDTRTGAQLRSIEGHNGFVWAVALSPDGRELAAGGADPRIALWDLTKEPHARVLRGHSAAITTLSYSSDQRFLASSSDDRTAKIWDQRTGAPLVTLEGHRAELTGAIFRPDGELVATSARDGTARVWARDSGRLLSEIDSHHGAIYALAFTPDGNWLLTGGGDRVLRAWDIAPSEIGLERLDLVVRCHAGYRLEGGRLIPTATESRACADLLEM